MESEGDDEEDADDEDDNEEDDEEEEEKDKDREDNDKEEQGAKRPRQGHIYSNIHTPVMINRMTTPK